MNRALLQTQPRLVTLEGGEGAGKSTALAAVRDALLASGDEVVCTREPGGTPLAELIRGLLLGTQADGSQHEPPAPTTELLLMFAARAQLLHETILPALQRGAWVVSDRFTDASYAYQGAGRGCDDAFIAQLEGHAVGVAPGLTLLLDVPVDVGLHRARQRGAADRIESERVEFFERVRAGYLARARAQPLRFRIIDATQSMPVVAVQVAAHLRAHMDATR